MNFRNNVSQLENLRRNVTSWFVGIFNVASIKSCISYIFDKKMLLVITLIVPFKGLEKMFHVRVQLQTLLTSKIFNAINKTGLLAN